MEDKEIKLIITALNEKFEKQKEAHGIAIKQIQELCNHKTLKLVMAGHQCTTCGKFIYEGRKLQKYILKEE